MESYNINKEFRNYGNRYEELQAIQINEGHIKQINNDSEGKEVVVKAENLKFVYEFEIRREGRYFKELRILNWFNRVLFKAYQGDYILRDKTGIYTLNKEKFESRYSILEYEI